MSVLKKKKSGFFTVLIIIASLFCLVYLGLFKTLVFIEDEAFELLYPKKALWEFRTDLLCKGIRLRTVKLDKKTMDSISSMDEKLSKFKWADYVVLSPVTSLSFRFFNIDSSSLFPKAPVIALGSEKDSCFDIALKTDEQMLSPVCPEEDSSAVDYRYSQAVPSSSLKGVYAPDLSVSIIPLLEKDKAALPEIGILVYNYYEI